MKNINKNHNKYFYFLFTLLFFSSMFTVFGSPKEEVAATSQSSSIVPQISYSVTGNKTVGSTITIAVNVTNGADIYGGSLDLLFDSNLLEVTSAKMGSLFEKDLKAPLINDTKTPGKTSVVVTLSGANKKLSVTSGSLVIIDAKIKKAGTLNLKTTNDLSKLNLNDCTSCIKLSAINGRKLTYSYNDLSISYNNIIPVIKSIDYDLNPPLPTNTMVKFTTSATIENDNTLYQYWINDSTGWKMVRDYSTSPSYTCSFKTEGIHSIRVYVKSRYSNKIADSIKTINYSITNSVNNSIVIKSINTSLNSIKKVGEKITFSTTLTSPNNNSLYQYWIKDKFGWKMIRDYDSSSNFTWIPSIPGDYSIRVYAKYKSSNKIADSIKTLDFHIDNCQASPVEIKCINSNSTSPIQVGDDVLLYTSTSGAYSSPMYQYWIKDNSSEEWHLVKDYDYSPYFSWSPSATGNYSIRVYAKDETSTKIADSIKTVNFTVKNDNPTLVSIKSITASCPSPQVVNKSIVFSTNLSSANSTTLYKYWINDSSGWKVIKDYNKSQYLKWTPSTAGNYSIRVYAKDETSTKIADSIMTINFTITQPTS